MVSGLDLATWPLLDRDPFMSKLVAKPLILGGMEASLRPPAPFPLPVREQG